MTTGHCEGCERDLALLGGYLGPNDWAMSAGDKLAWLHRRHQDAHPPFLRLDLLVESPPMTEIPSA